MTETKHAFRVLDDVGTPDLWERIESGTPRGDDPEPARPMWRRVASVAIAAVITAAIVFVLSAAFRADDTVTFQFVGSDDAANALFGLAQSFIG